jgi:hypothetical protein
VHRRNCKKNVINFSASERLTAASPVEGRNNTLFVGKFKIYTRIRKKYNSETLDYNLLDIFSPRCVVMKKKE